MSPKPGMSRSKTLLIFFSLMNAVLMTVFTFLWINNSYILTDDEEFMIKATSGIRNTLLGAKQKPDPDNFLFIDIAWEKQLVEEKTEEGERIGVRAITNRKRLAELLSHLHRTNQHKFIILDVFFKDSSSYQSDSLLQAALSKTKNILIPYHTDEDGSPIMPIFNTPVALSDYDKDDLDNNFVKFKILYDNKFRTTPLVMYETLHGKKYQNHGLYGTSDGSLALSSFILDMQIWSYDLARQTETISEDESEAAPERNRYQTLYLSDLLVDALNPAFASEVSGDSSEEYAIHQAVAGELIHELTKDRIIVIGDFSDGDLHETIYGATPGPLILLNVYLALQEGDNLFSIWFVFFLMAGFYYISYNCFRGRDMFVQYVNRISRKVRKINRASLFLNFMSYILYFIILSILSFFLFNIHITILLLAVYMEILEKVVRYFKKKRLPSS